jgi:hypothetical protein
MSAETSIVLGKPVIEIERDGAPDANYEGRQAMYVHIDGIVLYFLDEAEAEKMARAILKPLGGLTIPRLFFLFAWFERPRGGLRDLQSVFQDSELEFAKLCYERGAWGGGHVAQLEADGTFKIVWDPHG